VFDPLFALYWSRQVCIRAFPALSVAYLGEIADGNIAAPTDVAAGAGAGERVAVEGADAVGAGRAGRAAVDDWGEGAAAAGAGAEGAAKSAPHSAFLKSLYF
jgi:hypothetical protein